MIEHSNRALFLYYGIIQFWLFRYVYHCALLTLIIFICLITNTVMWFVGLKLFGHNQFWDMYKNVLWLILLISTRWGSTQVLVRVEFHPVKIYIVDTFLLYSNFCCPYFDISVFIGLSVNIDVSASVQIWHFQTRQADWLTINCIDIYIIRITFYFPKI